MLLNLGRRCLKQYATATTSSAGPLEILYRSIYQTPFGALNLGVKGDGTLVELWLPNRNRRDVTPEPFPRRARAGMDAVQTQLREYFAGTRRAFERE